MIVSDMFCALTPRRWWQLSLALAHPAAGPVYHGLRCRISAENAHRHPIGNVLKLGPGPLRLGAAVGTVLLVVRRGSSPAYPPAGLSQASSRSNIQLHICCTSVSSNAGGCGPTGKSTEEEAVGFITASMVM